ncbi:MAG: glycosyltransferase [Bacilli bacterium]|jgi:glycosyltransferase involved in cell wall biosynthesis
MIIENENGYPIAKHNILVFFPNIMQRGGIENIILNYVKNVDRSIFHYDVLQCGNAKGAYDDILESYGASLIYLNADLSFFRLVDYLKKLRKKNSYHIIDFHADNYATKAIIASFLAGYKIRISYSHNTSLPGPKIKTHFKNALTTLFTNVHIADSKEAGEWLFHYGKFAVIQPSINAALFGFDIGNRSNIRDKYNIPIDGKLIGCIGHLLDSHKFQSFLIDVFSVLSKRSEKYYLMLIGDGRDRYFLEEKCRNYKLMDKVIFTGTVEQTAPYLSAFDVFALTSHHEGLPISIIEAVANGLNCVISDRVPKADGLERYLASHSHSEKMDIWADEIERQIAQRKFAMPSEIMDFEYDNLHSAKKMETIYKHKLEIKRGKSHDSI